MIDRLFRRWNHTLSAALVFMLGPALAAAQLRVAQWNVTYYSSGRVYEFQTAIYGVYAGRSLTPDVIIGQEFMSAAAVANFRNLLNSAPGSPADWASAPFVDGPDTDSAFFYRTSKVDFLGHTVVAVGGSSPNHPRNIMRYDVRLKNYAAPAAVLACYSSHMKSGGTTDDQNRRLLEAQRIRQNAENLNPAWQFLLGADLNIQSSNEAAYQQLVASFVNNRGRLFDPIKTPGDWNNNYAFRFVHTQDPVGSGGMDDRFDQILLSAGLIDGDGFDYIGNPGVPYSTTTWNDPNHSYRAWGNDGTSFNSQLTTVGNEMVGQTIAQALVSAALTGGHIPVFLDLRVPPKVASDAILDFGRVRQGAVAQRPLSVWNSGDSALWTVNGIAVLRYALAASAGFAAPPGQFADAAGGGQNTHPIGMDTGTVGLKSGTLTIASNAPDEPIRIVELRGEVFAAALGDLNCDGAVNTFDIDPFVLALIDPHGYTQQYPHCDRLLADANQDGVVNTFDIDAFVDLLSG